MSIDSPDIFGSEFALSIYKQKYSMGGKERWADTCKRVITSVCQGLLPTKDQEALYQVMLCRKFIPAGRYLYSSGRPFHQVNNCFLFRAEDTREGWADIMSKCSSSLLTGGGIGVDYSLIRHEGAPIARTGGECTGPLALMQMVNEAGRHIMQGGQRRSAIWAGLNWKHRDVFKFLKIKDWPQSIRDLKAQDFNHPAVLDGTNISVIYDTEFFIAINDDTHPLHGHACNIWLDNCKQAFRSAEPGMSMNYLKDEESLRNACCEVTSEDDSDKCNLGTVWLPYITDKDDFSRTIKLAIKFLLCGSIYSDVPTDRIKLIGDQNNRIGLGLGGVHEWLMLNGMDYEATPELHKWLRIYEHESDAAAYIYSKRLGVNRPIGVRAIAPTGTIGIIAETTTGIEPLFCKAYKRRYLKDKVWVYQYVVDGSVKRLMDRGVQLEKIQDAYDISFKQRVKFQAEVQSYVDMAISSTCNMSEWGSEKNNSKTVEKNAKILLKYAKHLRGFTCYPDGSRGGQPLTRVDLNEAMGQEGTVFEEKEHECVGGVCGV